MNTPIVVRRGDTAKPDPFTILVVANPALEAPERSGQFIADPIRHDQPAFDRAVRYIEDALFGSLPGQAEPLLGHPQLAPLVRVLSLFPSPQPVDDAHALVAQDASSSLLLARRTVIRDFVAGLGLVADVVFAVSKAAIHDRASAWYTSDDDAGPGVPFVLDGVTMFHRHRYVIPGTVAIHCTASSLTAAHEFQHAISSYSNGRITDLYVDSQRAVNCRRGRPIPSLFCTYQTTAHQAGLTRDHIGYPSGWQSYHCALIDQNRPALMDNYWLSTPPEACQNDSVTRAFIFDRVRAKTQR